MLASTCTREELTMAPSFGNDIDPPAGNPDAKAPSLEAREKNKKL